MKWKITLGLALAATLATAPEASAQAISGPVASNAYITFNGLDWAWASPCSGVQPSCAGFNINGGGGGWRFASAGEWASRPAPSDFLRPDGNLIGYGGPGLMACASAWFATNPDYQHCDYIDGVNGYIMSGQGNYGSQGDNSWNDTYLVRVSATPEPASIALMATGILGVGVVARRRRRNQTV